MWTLLALLTRLKLTVWALLAHTALGLCLGNRADADTVRPGAQRADICARFQLKKSPSAQQWLIANHLDDQGECLLRRVISADGRSRGFINGTAVPLSQLRELGQLLIQIHGQHAHQLLLKADHQRTLLDAYSVKGPAQFLTSPIVRNSTYNCAGNGVSISFSQRSSKMSDHALFFSHVAFADGRCGSGWSIINLQFEVNIVKI